MGAVSWECLNSIASERLGVSIVGRYDDDARPERVGQFSPRSAAIGAVVSPGLESASAALRG